jgi:L-fuculose-phosphate aldolase
MLEAERRAVADGARRLAAEGLVLGTAGNLSLRSDERVAVSPTGAVLADLSPEQVAVVDLDGRQLWGELAPTSELDLHLGVIAGHGANTVVHTHSPMATAVSCVLDELPVVHYAMLGLGGSVRVAPYATFGTAQLAEVTLAALEGRAAALMANHGAIVHGDGIEAAVENARLLEWACSVYWHASALGKPRTLSAEQQQDVVSEVLRRGYGDRSAAA